MTAPNIPDGYVAFGWHQYKGGGLSALAHLSAAHLVPESQVQVGVATGTERAYGPSLCGRSTRHRVDSINVVESEMIRGERKPCSRCFAKVG